jgi:hypothetical protein
VNEVDSRGEAFGVGAGESQSQPGFSCAPGASQCEEANVRAAQKVGGFGNVALAANERSGHDREIALVPGRSEGTPAGLIRCEGIKHHRERIACGLGAEYFGSEEIAAAWHRLQQLLPAILECAA